MPRSFLRFTSRKKSLKPLFTPFSLPPRAPNIILKLLHLVHLRQSLDLLVFPNLCQLVLIEAVKTEKPGHRCPGPVDDAHASTVEVFENLAVRNLLSNGGRSSAKSNRSAILPNHINLASSSCASVRGNVDRIEEHQNGGRTLCKPESLIAPLGL